MRSLTAPPPPQKKKKKKRFLSTVLPDAMTKFSLGLISPVDFPTWYLVWLLKVVTFIAGISDVWDAQVSRVSVKHQTYVESFVQDSHAWESRKKPLLCVHTQTAMYMLVGSALAQPRLLSGIITLASSIKPTWHQRNIRTASTTNNTDFGVFIFDNLEMVPSDSILRW